MKIKNHQGSLSALRLSFILGVIAPIAFAAPQESDSFVAQQNSSISSQADLDELVAQLDQPETRLGALGKLIRFSHFRLYQVGSVFMIERNPKLSDEQNRTLNELREKAVEAIRKHASFEAVKQALDSPESGLQFWGLWFYRQGVWQDRQRKGLPTAANDWDSLLPRIKELAEGDDERSRTSAIEELQGHSEFREFLEQRLKVETSPEIVMRLVYSDDKSVFSAKLNPYLLRFLLSPNAKIRMRTLGFMSMNPNRAPMWQVNFDQPLKERLVEMSKSGSEDERRVALFALQGMQEKPRNE